MTIKVIILRAPDSFIRGFYGTPILRTSLARAKSKEKGVKEMSTNSVTTNSNVKQV